MASIHFDINDDRGVELLLKLMGVQNSEATLHRIERKVDHVHKMIHALAPDNAALTELAQKTAQMVASGDAVRDALNAQTPPVT